MAFNQMASPFYNLNCLQPIVGFHDKPNQQPDKLVFDVQPYLLSTGIGTIST